MTAVTDTSAGITAYAEAFHAALCLITDDSQQALAGLAESLQYGLTGINGYIAQAGALAAERDAALAALHVTPLAAEAVAVVTGMWLAREFRSPDHAH